MTEVRLLEVLFDLVKLNKLGQGMCGLQHPIITAGGRLENKAFHNINAMYLCRVAAVPPREYVSRPGEAQELHACIPADRLLLMPCAHVHTQLYIMTYIYIYTYIRMSVGK